MHSKLTFTFRSLRTLEFWVDNLNSDFLFPILSDQQDLHTRLMKALSIHLQPAPYQYGAYDMVCGWGGFDIR
jgi:hypothetical protein